MDRDGKDVSEKPLYDTPLTRSGWPRPVLNGWPIPWVSPSGNLALMDEARMVACATGAICAVCGLDYDDGEVAYALVKRRDELPADLTGGAVKAMDNAVMHRRCLLLSLKRCPRLAQLRVCGLLKVVRTVGNRARPRRGKAVIDGVYCEPVGFDQI